MTADATLLAGRLLDAQVAWALDQLSGDQFAAMVRRDIDEGLAVCSSLTFGQIISADDVKAAARRLVDVIGGSGLLTDLPQSLAAAIYDLEASEEHSLGELVDRESVDALIVQLLAMHQLQDRAMDRLAESPLVAAIATRYVTKLVGDFLQQNRERAEKLPGVSSLFSIGLGAASKVRGATDQFLGDAQARSTQFAMRRSNSAVREMIRDAPARAAALEVWDLQAAEPISALREYLTRQDLRELLEIIQQIIVAGRNLDYVGVALDECVDVFFDRYGTTDVATLLADVGISRDVLVDTVQAFAPPVIETLRREGRLDALVRARLEPFFASEHVLALLGGEAAARPKPRPKATPKK